MVGNKDVHMHSRGMVMVQTPNGRRRDAHALVSLDNKLKREVADWTPIHTKKNKLPQIISFCSILKSISDAIKHSH